MCGKKYLKIGKISKESEIKLRPLTTPPIIEEELEEQVKEDGLDVGSGSVGDNGIDLSSGELYC